MHIMKLTFHSEGQATHIMTIDFKEESASYITPNVDALVAEFIKLTSNFASEETVSQLVDVLIKGLQSDNYQQGGHFSVNLVLEPTFDPQLN